jgi:hypothetical protein
MHRMHQQVESMQKSLGPGSIGRRQIISGRMAAAALVVSLLLGGCTLLPERFSSPPPEQTLFLQGLDALSTTRSSEAFSRLVSEYPDSPWTARAKAIKQIQGQLQEAQRQGSQQQRRLEECRLERDQLATDVRSREEAQKAFVACRSERERLARDVRSLEEYTRRLKSLLAESGIAEPMPPAR